MWPFKKKPKTYEWVPVGYLGRIYNEITETTITGEISYDPMACVFTLRVNEHNQPDSVLVFHTGEEANRVLRLRYPLMELEPTQFFLRKADKIAFLDIRKGRVALIRVRTYEYTTRDKYGEFKGVWDGEGARVGSEFVLGVPLAVGETIEL